MTLLVHILGGALGIVAGAVALSAAKGARLHRASGLLFVYAMVAMSLSGSLMAAFRGVESSVIGGLLAASLVVTALTTVRPPSAWSRRLDFGAMLVGLAVGLNCVTRGLEALARGSFTTANGVPVPMVFVFGAVALLAAGSDLRVLRSGPPRGPARLARHLWRMCFALWIATGSFFLGQADEFPEPLRVPALLAVPALLPLVLMVYWLWRVRAGRTGRRAFGAPSSARPYEAAGGPLPAAAPRPAGASRLEIGGRVA